MACARLVLLVYVHLCLSIGRPVMPGIMDGMLIVGMASSQDNVRRLLWSRSFTLQLVVEFLELFKVLPKTWYVEADYGAGR